MVHLWNIHYQDENLTNVCDNTEYGCCPPIHTGCDSVFRIMKGENSINTVNKYLQIKDNYTYSTIPKEDHRGMNCPHYPFEYIHGFENGWPSQTTHFPWFLIILILIVITYIAINNCN